jgi:hypothetical protein
VKSETGLRIKIRINGEAFVVRGSWLNGSPASNLGDRTAGTAGQGRVGEWLGEKGGCGNPSQLRIVNREWEKVKRGRRERRKPWGTGPHATEGRHWEYERGSGPGAMFDVEKQERR